MVISGKVRGNAPQLAGYLLSQGDNEKITILDINGGSIASPDALRNLLYSMELNSELTRSRNSVYHAHINPSPTHKEDRAMTMDEWKKSADILAQELNLQEQRRVIVLHEKKGRIHAHVVYERYDHERGTMIDYKHNYKAHDNARFKLEKELNHQPTPVKNKNRDKHKETLTVIWKQSKSGKEFIEEAKKNGYQVAAGTDRPYKVIDEDGIAFDLVRKLDGVKTKEVREKLANEKLVAEKEALQLHNKPALNPESEAVPQDHLPRKEKEVAFEAVPQSNTKSNDDEQREEIERQRRAFIEQMRQAKEQNERRNNLFRTFCLASALIVRVALDRYSSKPKQLIDYFKENKVEISAATGISSRKELGYIEAAQYYKPT